MDLRPDQIPLALLLGGLAYLLFHEVSLLRSSFRERFVPWALGFTLNACLFIGARWVQRAAMEPELALMGIRIQLASTVLIAFLGIGALRGFVGAPTRTRGMGIAGLLAAALFVIVVATPWFVGHEARIRTDILGVRYYEAVRSPALLVFAPFGIAVGAYAVRLIKRARVGGRTPATMFRVAGVLLVLFGVNDVLNGMGLIHTMQLFEYGFVLVAMASGNYVQRRVDDIHTHLEAAVEERTRELEEGRREVERVLADLEASETRLRQLHDATLEAVVFVESSGHIRDANAALARMFGRPAEGLRGAALSTLFVADANNSLLALVRGDEAGPSELEGLRGDGTRFVIEAAVAPHARGDARALVLRDVTEQRAMQTRLQRADRLASMGMLAAGTAHEINNPLAYVVTNAQLLREELERLAREVDPTRLEEARQLVTDITLGSERVRRIVRDLTAFARETPAESGPLDIRKVLDLSLELAGNEIRHRAQVRREYADVGPVVGSEVRLGQAFLNLLVNAAHAIEPGRVEHNEITVRVREAGADIVVEIEDTGVGMEATTAERIFDPFFTTKTLGQGTGLGLSICHGVITSLGGRIEVESDRGVGTKFTVTLPMADRAELPDPSSKLRPRSGKATARARVLVVDDEVGVARAFKRALREHDVTLAHSGRGALDQCAEQDFDLVICDLMMPDLTGMDVYAELVERRPALAARIVFVTGGVFTEAARTFLDEVDNPCFEKPLDVRALREVVANHAVAAEGPANPRISRRQS